eukprot:GHRR01002096.1.p2 GENE.GHRR01002096.1~~GHRR01002096.1.p2  ORF type:complete len:117 (+),score=50.38 GHRR01002096.1:330-680(+)
MASVAQHHAGAGTLLLAPQQVSQNPAITITDSVTLRLVPRRKKKSVKWAEDVEDHDENAGKRKSKKCCIFHKRRQFGDWSDDDDDDDSDIGCNGDDQQQHHSRPSSSGVQQLQQQQ